MAKRNRRHLRVGRRIGVGVFILISLVAVYVAIDWQRVRSHYAALLSHDPYADVFYANAYELMIWEESEALARARERLKGPLPLDRMYSAHLDGPWLSDANAAEVAATLEAIAIEEEYRLILIDTALTDRGFETMKGFRHLTALVIRNKDGQRKRPHGANGWIILGYQPPEPVPLGGG